LKKGKYSGSVLDGRGEAHRENILFRDTSVWPLYKKNRKTPGRLTFA
jgi:hypothetical protein